MRRSLWCGGTSHFDPSLRDRRDSSSAVVMSSNALAISQICSRGRFFSSPNARAGPKQKRPGLSTRPLQTLIRRFCVAKTQLAFFTNTGLPTFFSIARFRSSARGESTSALALIKYASRPPLWSTLLSALVETRRRTLRARASEMKVTLTRFGRKRRLVLMLEWLTLWPTWGPLAVSSQRRDMAKSSIFPNDVRPPFGAPRANSLSLQGAGGRIGGKGRAVKVLGRLGRQFRAQHSMSSPGLTGRSSTPGRLWLTRGGAAYWMPAFAGMTAEWEVRASDPPRSPKRQCLKRLTIT